MFFFFFLPRRNIIFENPVRNGILREKGLIHGVLDHVTLLHKNNQNFLGPNTGAFSANSQTPVDQPVFISEFGFKNVIYVVLSFWHLV